MAVQLVELMYGWKSPIMRIAKLELSIIAMAKATLLWSGKMITPSI